MNISLDDNLEKKQQRNHNDRNPLLENNNKKKKSLKIEKLPYFNERILPNDLKTFNSNDLAKYFRNKIQFNNNDLNPLKEQTLTKNEQILEMRRIKFDEFNKMILQNKKIVNTLSNFKEY